MAINHLLFETILTRKYATFDGKSHITAEARMFLSAEPGYPREFVKENYV
jgi:hypothetical protein